LDAFIDIEKKLYVDGWKPITKLFDEHNFEKYTEGVI